MKKCILINSLLLCLSQAEVQKDISCSSDNHSQKRLDIYKPSNNNNSPVLIHIHGGGWKTGDKKVQRQHGNFYSSHNIVFININYRLSPEVTHPLHVEDCAEAIAWVFKHLDELGGDKNRVFISGHSAGAHLTTLVAINSSYLNKYNIRTIQLAGIIPVDTASFDLLSRGNNWFSK